MNLIDVMAFYCTLIRIEIRPWAGHLSGHASSTLRLAHLHTGRPDWLAWNKWWQKCVCVCVWLVAVGKSLNSVDEKEKAFFNCLSRITHTHTHNITFTSYMDVQCQLTTRAFSHSHGHLSLTHSAGDDEAVAQRDVVVVIHGGGERVGITVASSGKGQKPHSRRAKHPHTQSEAKVTRRFRFLILTRAKSQYIPSLPRIIVFVWEISLSHSFRVSRAFDWKVFFFLESPPSFLSFPDSLIREVSRSYQTQSSKSEVKPSTHSQIFSQLFFTRDEKASKFGSAFSPNHSGHVVGAGLFPRFNE